MWALHGVEHHGRLHRLCLPRHAAFFGFGAYAFGLVLAHLGIQAGYEPFLFVPIAGVLTVVLALVIGWIALRTRAATFVIVTIAMMFMVQLLAENLVGLTGGGSGLSFPVPPWTGDFFDTPFYYAMLVMAVVSLLLSWWIRRSKFGLGLLAIRDDEDKALAVGVPAHAYKLTAFVISAGLVGMIGAVYGYYVTYIYPQYAIDPLVGISLVLMVFLAVLARSGARCWVRSSWNRHSSGWRTTSARACCTSSSTQPCSWSSSCCSPAASSRQSATSSSGSPPGARRPVRHRVDE